MSSCSLKKKKKSAKNGQPGIQIVAKLPGEVQLLTGEERVSGEIYGEGSPGLHPGLSVSGNDGSVP